MEIPYQEPQTITSEMKRMLAECYSNRVFREYITKQINTATKKAVEQASSMEELNRMRGRISAWKELLVNGKKYFEDTQKDKKIPFSEKI